MRTATVYVTIDGRQFDDATKARDHEDRLHNVWLKENPMWSNFVNAAGEPAVKEARAKVVRDFWEWNYGK